MNIRCSDSVQLRTRRARRDEIFRFIGSKPFTQLVPEQKEVNTHLKNDGANRQIPDFPNLKAWYP